MFRLCYKSVKLFFSRIFFVIFDRLAVLLLLVSMIVANVEAVRRAGRELDSAGRTELWPLTQPAGLVCVVPITWRSLSLAQSQLRSVLFIFQFVDEAIQRVIAAYSSIEEFIHFFA